MRGLNNDDGREKAIYNMMGTLVAELSSQEVHESLPFQFLECVLFSYFQFQTAKTELLMDLFFDL